MSSSLRAAERRPSVADWSAGICQRLGRSNCSLMQAMDGRIVRCVIISSYQSAAASKTVFKALLVTSLTHVNSSILYQVPDLLFNIKPNFIAGKAEN